MRGTFASLSCALLLGCSGGGGGSGLDAATPADLSTLPDLAGFTPAAHAPFPLMTNHTAGVLSAPELVTVTFQGYAFQSDAEAFGDWVVGSDYLKQVGADYGVGAGTHLKKVQIPGAPPTTLTDGDVVNLLTAQMMNGTVPMPNPQIVYLVYLPTGVTFDDPNLGAVCKGWDGYHSFSTAGALPSFPYALVADCLHDVQGDLIPTASHEFVEAATDPIDGWYLDVPPPDLWSTQLYEEVVDLCQYELNVQQGPYTVQRVYSNSAAMGGGSPCIPVPQGEVFFDVTTQPTTVLTAPPGGSIQATLIGWSTGPIAPWPISTYIADAADFDPTPMLSQQTIGNGDQVQVTLHVPSSAASGQIGASFIFSDNGQLRFWPVAVQVQ